MEGAYTRLAPVSDYPALEVQLLLSHVLDKSRTWVVAQPEHELQPDQIETLEDLLERLQRREPLPYLLKKAEFYGLTFQVSPSVLIPRPETELLVEHAIQWLKSDPGRRRVVDVGTGSGAIAITIAVNCPDADILAIDRSWTALEIARENIRAQDGKIRIQLLQADLVEPVKGSFDLVCANLPYIPTEKLAELEVSRYEPPLALDGGPDGLRLIERLLADLPLILAPGGLAFFEIESSQGEMSLVLARQYLPAAESRVLHDLAGHPRLLKIVN
jgi:release factor glutamine methyltransferase